MACMTGSSFFSEQSVLAKLGRVCVEAGERAERHKKQLREGTDSRVSFLISFRIQTKGEASAGQQ